MEERTRFDLGQEDIPAAWFNLLPSMVGAGMQPLPPLHPGTHEPVTPDLLAPLFPEELIALGSVLNHVLLHQTVIGLEAKRQMELAGEEPDVVIGCVGGGSNYAGLSYPFMADRLSGARPGIRFVACEPAACPTLTRGRFAYDFGDTGGMTPLLPMYTLGHGFVPAPVHAGGLRYHGDAPSLSLLVREGHMEARAFTQNEVFEAAVLFARTQGIVPGPEPAHAVRAAIDEALAAREAGEARVILFNLSGHGHFDMQAYDDYLHGRLPEVEFREKDVEAGLASVPEVPIPG